MLSIFNIWYTCFLSYFSRLREDGKTEDTGDFSDFYIPPAPGMNEDESKQLQELQDEVHMLCLAIMIVNLKKKNVWL